MSRSGYSYDLDQWDLIRWRGAVASAIRGRRGQAFFAELLTALDTMQEKRLIDGELEQDGEVCALGSLGRKRGIDQSKIDPYDREQIAKTFGIAAALAAEVAFMNDDWHGELPEHRWTRMRAWVAEQIHAGNPMGSGGPKVTS
jgi:hypothetical protein